VFLRSANPSPKSEKLILLLAISISGSFSFLSTWDFKVFSSKADSVSPCSETSSEVF
jgi:hypothetical protein